MSARHVYITWGLRIGHNSCISHSIRSIRSYYGGLGLRASDLGAGVLFLDPKDQSA